MRTAPIYKRPRNPHFPETLPIPRKGFTYHGEYFKTLGDARHLSDYGLNGVYIADGVDSMGHPCRYYFDVSYRDIDAAKDGKLLWGRSFSDMERLSDAAWDTRARKGTFNIDPVLEPSDVRSMDDLRDFYTTRYPWTAPYLNDPEVWSWICDYYGYLAWNEHGNQPSLVEDAGEGYMASLVMDLVRSCDSNYTYYLTNGGDVDSLDDTERSLLDRRVGIQKRYGVKPDWKVPRNMRSGKSRSMNKRSFWRRRYVPHREETRRSVRTHPRR